MTRQEKKQLLVCLLKYNPTQFRRYALNLLQSNAVNRRELFDLITAEELLCKKFRSCFYGKGVEKIGKDGFSYNRNLKSHTAFESAFFLFRLYRPELNCFVRLRAEYETHRLLKEYGAAVKVLDKIEQEVGVSLWSCAQWMLIRELSEGLEANKRELTRLTSEIPSQLVTVFLLSFYSSLAETDLSYENYRIETIKNIHKYEGSAVSKYWTDKALLDAPTDGLDHSLLLQVDMQCSITDLFLTVEKTLPLYYRDAICGGTFDIGMVRACRVESGLFRNLKIIYAEDAGEAREIAATHLDMYQIIEAYAIGNYETAATKAQSYLLKKPYDFQIATLFCKSLLNAGRPFPPDLNVDYIAAVYSIYSMDGTCRESVSLLQKELKRNFSSILCIKMRSFLNRKHFSEETDPLIFYSAMLDESVHPNFCRFLDDSMPDFWGQIFCETAPVCSAVVQARLTGDFSDPLLWQANEQRRLFSQAREACDHGNFPAARNYIDRLEPLCSAASQCGALYEKERLLRLKLLLFGQQELYCSAIHLLVDAFFENKDLFDRLAGGGYFELPRKLRDKAVGKDVYYCVLLYLLDHNDYQKQIVAYNNLLDLNGYESVFDALSALQGGESDIWTYFFYEVCSVSLLKRDHRLFAEKILPQTARLEILQMLQKRKEEKKYLREINELYTEEALYDKLRTINKSRIHVDTDKIYDSKRILWEELYRKYLASRGFRDSTVGDVNFIRLGQDVALDGLSYTLLDSPQIQQKTMVLRSIIEQILEECLYSTRYGLETYLSSRIRHGFCTSQLLGFLTEQNLISMRVGGDEDEYINDYWDEKAKKKTPAYLKIKQELDVFTKKISAKTEEVRTKWIRIKYKEPSEGMFDYTNLSDIIGFCAMIEKWEPKEDFSSFYKEIILIFWEYTDQSLQKIKERIDHELTPFFIETIDELERRLKDIQCDKVTGSIRQDLLNHCHAAKSTVISAVEQFKEIFSRAPSNYADFTMQELTESCRKISEKLYGRDGMIRWEVSADRKSVFKGRYFLSFVDVLSILLNNALTHAGTMKQEKMMIRMEIGELAGKDKEKVLKDLDLHHPSEYHVFRLQVSNTLGRHVDAETLREKIKQIFEQIRQEEGASKNIQEEGGSGLYKLCKTAAYNIDVPHVIYYKVDKEFSISYCFISDTLMLSGGGQ